jgi:soluble lytic murein transglycosylase
MSGLGRKFQPSHTVWQALGVIAVASVLGLVSPAPAETVATTPDAKTTPAKTSAAAISKAKPSAKDAVKDSKHAAKAKGKKTAKAAAKTKSAVKKTTASKAKTLATKTAATKTKTAGHAVPMPRSRPGVVVASLRGTTSSSSAVGAPTNLAALTPPTREAPINRPATVAAPPVLGSANPPSAADVDAVRQAVVALRGGDPADAMRQAAAMSDPLARKLTEWIILRSDNNSLPFARYAAFIAANPTWPSLSMFRKRAESMIWLERPDDSVARTYFAANPPSTGKGRLALARALLAQGDRTRAQALVREAWRSDSLSSEAEAQTREEFGVLLQPGDDKARMERRLYANDTEAGMRAARKLGGVQLAIAKLRVAVTEKSGHAKALAEAVAKDARHDIGYLFAQLQLLRRADKITEAGHLMLTVPRDTSQLHDTDEWWIERRLLARKLLDVNEPRLAYQVAREAATPNKEVYKVESQFTAGWIALRFLDDPKTAMAHFARIPDVTDNPISLSRAGYWLGRAAEAANRPQEARKYYESAAQWTTAYYGQIARGRLGMSEMIVSAPPVSPAQLASVERLELVRAAEVLYALNERNLALSLMADLGDKLDDLGALAALGEITERQRDARAMMQLGKAALARGHAFAQYAFPAIGIPDYTPVGPPIDPALVYSIVRTESAFYQGDLSGAQAMGLMQVTPDAGKDTCKRFGCTFDRKRLMNDSVYNVQVGSAELAAVIDDYRGSYIMAFAAYNAGRGRVKEWVARYGDPRDPGVDPIDWVERIPFSETRNYVQRVMENLQVYRVRFGGGSKLLIEADLRRGAAAN